MSFDLAFWHPTELVTAEQAQQVYEVSCNDDSTLLPSSRSMVDFISDLTSRYAEIDDYPEEDVDDCPWSVAFDKSSAHLIVCISWSRVEDVFPLLLELANRHHLLCFDPQAADVFMPAEIVHPEPPSERPQWDTGLSADEEAELQEISEQLDAAVLPELVRRAEANDLDAQFELGNRYAFGDDVSVDHEKSFEWYLKAAHRGHVDSMFNLASCFRRGDGTDREIEKAIMWYEKAAKSDNVVSPFALGDIYASGDGVSVDPERALQYYTIALEHGHPDARRAIRILRESIETPSRTESRE